MKNLNGERKYREILWNIKIMSYVNKTYVLLLWYMTLPFILLMHKLYIGDYHII